MENKIQKKENNQLITEFEVGSKLDILVEGQTNNLKQLQTLVEEGWIAIDRSKRGPANHKAFLTKEGKKLVKDRQKDFQFIFLMKEPDSYVFTNESNHSKILTRETITKAVNLVTRTVSEEILSKPNITSHSFRIGYITQLWKDSKDIEFVKQTIGHRNLDTTSAYVNRLSDQERRERIFQLDQMCSEKGLGKST